MSDHSGFFSSKSWPNWRRLQP